MTRKEIKLQKIQTAETRRRLERRQMRLERKSSQMSGFILSFGEVFDTLIPFGIGPALCRSAVRRRIRRQTSGA